MRTSVTVPGTDETDEFPDCGGMVDTESGDLTIVDSTMGVEATYLAGGWEEFTTVAT